MEGTEFDEADFFRSIASSGVRALLIGRRALVALGIPVLTADYDFWIHPDDATALNAARKEWTNERRRENTRQTARPGRANAFAGRMG
jgi:hypothetical protein